MMTYYDQDMIIIGRGWELHLPPRVTRTATRSSRRPTAAGIIAEGGGAADQVVAGAAAADGTYKPLPAKEGSAGAASVEWFQSRESLANLSIEHAGK